MLKHFWQLFRISNIVTYWNFNGPLIFFTGPPTFSSAMNQALASFAGFVMINNTIPTGGRGRDSKKDLNWNKSAVILTKFSSLAALEVVILTTSSAASDEIFIKMKTFLFQWYNISQDIVTGWETSARPLANASENLAGPVENRPGRVEFCIGYTRDYPIQASAKNF